MEIIKKFKEVFSDKNIVVTRNMIIAKTNQEIEDSDILDIIAAANGYGDYSIAKKKYDRAIKIEEELCKLNQEISMMRFQSQKREIKTQS